MTTVLTLPGWQGSGPEHWQSRWERRHGCVRVEQADWDHPEREAWIATLDACVAGADGPFVFAAHSLGCALVAHWAQRRGRGDAQLAKVRGALLVAPPDLERASAPPETRGFAPLPSEPLPMPSIVVASTSDPYCGFMRSGLLAAQWGAEFVSAGNAGHVNAESGLGDWEAGWALLRRWL